MADIIDSTVGNDDELLEYENLDNSKQESKQEIKQEQQTEQDDLPEKFKGKSAKEIAKAYEEVEKLAGRQAQEVGELRKLTDQILKNQLEAQKKPEPQAQEIDFFDDPEKAVKTLVDKHPSVLEARKAAAEMKAAQVRVALEEKHGKLDSYAADPEFVDYVKASKVRMRLMAAAENFDFDAADELLSTYKELKAVKAAKAEEQTKEIKQARDKSLSAASVPMSSGTGESSKKVFRRADLIKLKMTDPQRYEMMNDEIMAAYAEGRVK